MRYTKDFIEYLRVEKRYSSHTLLAYENDLNQYYVFLNTEGQEDELPDPVLIRGWVIFLLDKGLSPGSIHRKLSSLRRYCRYLMSREVLRSNPVDHVLKPKARKSLPEFIESDPLNTFLDTYPFGDDFPGVRDRVILELLYQTGMRRAEMVSLNLNSYRRAENQIIVHGKRNKERLIPVSRDMAFLLDTYIEKRKEQFPGVTEEALLLTNKGDAVYDKFIYRIVNKYLTFVTTRTQKSPHLLRHTFATHLLNHGADLNAIKELLGHANLSATQVYTHNQFENLKSIYKKAHPRAD